jgi:hypothetical protein
MIGFEGANYFYVFANGSHKTAKEVTSRLRSRKEGKTSVLQTAALFCIVVGVGMIASTYSGVLELFMGYVGGILLLATGATLFAYDQEPDKTVQSLKAFLNFLLAVAKSLAGIAKSRLEQR